MWLLFVLATPTLVVGFLLGVTSGSLRLARSSSMAIVAFAGLTLVNAVVALAWDASQRQFIGWPVIFVLGTFLILVPYGAGLAIGTGLVHWRTEKWRAARPCAPYIILGMALLGCMLLLRLSG